MKLKALEKVFSQGSNLAIYTHNNPDPDCIASGLILKRIAAFYKVKSNIIYSEELIRSENKKMVELLNIDLIHLDEVDLSRFDLHALVDTQKGINNNKFPRSLTPDITFDHHPFSGKKYNFYDINIGSGATCSILLGYFLKLNLKLDKTVATAYCYALITESRDLGRDTTEMDIKYYKKLIPYADLRILADIRNSQKPISYFKILKKALSNFKMNRSIVSCDIGKINSLDYIPEIADELIKIDTSKYSIVIGLFKGKFHLSARTISTNINIGAIINTVLVDIGDGGGHKMIGAGSFKGNKKTVEMVISNISKLIEKVDN